MGSASRPNLTRARKVHSAKPAAEPRRKPARTSVSHLNDILDRFGRSTAIRCDSKVRRIAPRKAQSPREANKLAYMPAPFSTGKNPVFHQFGTGGMRRTERHDGAYWRSEAADPFIYSGAHTSRIWNLNFHFWELHYKIPI